MILLLFSIIAIMLGILVFKITARLFSFAIRLMFSGLATALVIIPAIFCVLL